jgi:uncharacterized membrane protein HdeD (DUF308 family)
MQMLDPMSAAESVTEAEAEAASRRWWIVLLYGILSVFVGLLILADNWTLESLAIFVGVILIIEGLFSAIRPGLGAMRAWTVGIGIAAIIGGIVILVWPARGLLVLAQVIAVYIVVKGIFNLTISVGSRHAVNYWWLWSLLGILQIALGLWLMRRPGATLYLVIVLTGIWLIAQGSLEIVLAFEIKRLPRLLGQSRAQQQAAPPPPVRSGA